MTKDLFDKYIWLVDTIHRADRITLREINEKWAMSPLYDGADIPRRTFNNWKEAIQQAFDINIECRRVGGYHYYIENPEDLENSTTCSWLLNTFTVKNIISESKGIRDRILLENVPSGQKHLSRMDQIEVISPASLREEIRSTVQRIASRYQESPGR